MKNRNANLIPKWIQMRVDDNTLSIEYSVQDAEHKIDLNKIWISFKPTKELMDALEREIDFAVKNHVKE